MNKKKTIKIEIKPVFAGNPGVQIFDVVIYDATAKKANDKGKMTEGISGYWQAKKTFSSRETLEAFLEGVRICQTSIGTTPGSTIEIPPMPSCN